MSDFSEFVGHPLKLKFVTWLVVPLTAVLGLLFLVRGIDSGSPVMVGGAAVILAMGALLWRLGSGVTIKVEDGVLGLRQGPFHASLPVVEVVSAEPKPGHWWMELSRRYAFGTRCFMLSEVETGVHFELDDGRHFFVSTRRPDELLSAVAT